MNSLTREQFKALAYLAEAKSENTVATIADSIGLSIAAAIAEKHGGTIRAAMENDQLVLTCTLPREKT